MAITPEEKKKRTDSLKREQEAIDKMNALSPAKDHGPRECSCGPRVLCWKGRCVCGATTSEERDKKS